ncbi:MAG TPA: molybdate ABC transporter substrate-binding protein [Burkholderiaceae bacterium]|jgi:molybdate transport system substrate-binding protein|nr:molybdate ABC transporter substrate-binding protein [Burkholderiaceae bacterium]
MKNLYRFLLVLFFATGSVAHADVLTVAVAANAEYVFNDLAAEFKKESGHEVKPIINSSGKFVTQIMNGAPYDVFLSADMEFPEKLYKDGYAVASPKAYAYGALVVWTMKDLELSNWQKALTNAVVNKIAVANPQTAPYGRETMKALSAAKLDQILAPKLVFGESIAQTNQYIFSAAADVGFTAKSVVLSPELKGKGKWVDVPKDWYQPIAQGAVILKHGQDTNPKLAQEFFTFLYSDKARAILERYGYLLP